jgi:hypothetical protein
MSRFRFLPNTFALLRDALRSRQTLSRHIIPFTDCAPNGFRPASSGAHGSRFLERRPSTPRSIGRRPLPALEIGRNPIAPATWTCLRICFRSANPAFAEEPPASSHLSSPPFCPIRIRPQPGDCALYSRHSQKAFPFPFVDSSPNASPDSLPRASCAPSALSARFLNSSRIHKSLGRPEMFKRRAR